MILDQQTLLSDAQTVTITANSANVIDTLAPGMVTNDISVFAQVMTAFAGGTSLGIAVVSADDAALTVNVTKHFDTGAIPVASLTAKALPIAMRLPPQKMRRYVGLVYTVVGTMSAGTITAGIVEDLNTVLRTSDYAKGFSA
ncbi:Bbp16 family capsid cement protein [Paraburkholderia diazotrophica]|uniref:Uncharacterized protein n=1 Tax=Paraburkholderia diazotrophica TaxID=667676 RepID=A0A1H6UV93_9BURK|nr:hypothetical protein [Paraburkholderia diazotrophica]SEI96343.1 hypothetical protein SAMN05192539_1005214 [Paraburkholderia diazotrophica]